LALYKYFLCCIFFLPSALCTAANIVIVEDNPTTYYLWDNNIDYFEDITGKLTITDISSDKFKDSFKIPEQDRPKATSHNTSYWIRFTIKNQTTENTNWVLEFYDFRIDSLNIFIPDGFVYQNISGGDAYPFHYKAYKHKNFVYNFSLPEHEATYYVQAKAFENVGVFAVLKSHERFTSYAINEYFMLALFLWRFDFFDSI
jgi:hypothetical protein